VSKQEKALALVEHIEAHLREMTDEVGDDAVVICKICNKTIDQIWDERED